MDRISIVTPTYNAGGYVFETINSVLNQYPEVEYIVVDDGSIDYTSKFIRPYLRNCNFQYIYQENQGEQKAVNTGLHQITGDYFMVVNADDPLLPGCVKYLSEVLDSYPEILAVYPNYQIIDERGKLVRNMICPRWSMEYMVRKHRHIPGAGTMYRREVLDKVGYRDPHFTWLGDFDYFFRVGLAGNMVHLPMTLATWRRHEGQMTGKVNPLKAIQRKALMDKFFTLEDSEKYLHLKDEAYFWMYVVSAAQSQGVQRAKLLKKAIECYPSLPVHFRFWRDLLSYVKYYLQTRL